MLVQSRMGAGFGRAVAARMLLVVLVLSTSGHFTTSLPPNEGRATETGHVGSKLPRRTFAQCFTQSTRIMPRLLLRPGTFGAREKWNSCTNALYKAAPARSQGSQLRPLHGLTRPQAEQRQKADARGSSGDVGGEQGKRKWLNWPIFSNVHDREIIAMAIPSYTAVMLDPVATIIDVSFIGRLPDSSLSLAGMGISNSILNYFGFTFFFIVVTTTTRLAQTLAEATVVQSGGEHEGDGQGSADDAGTQQVSDDGKAAGSHVIAASMQVATFLGVLSACLSWSLAPQLVSLVAGSSDLELLPYAIAYMRNKCLGIPAMVLFFSIIGAYRGYRDLTTPLIGNVLSSLCKIALGYFFLFQLHFGVAGAGLADALARYAAAAVLMTLLVRDGRLRLRDLVRVPKHRLLLDLVAPGGALTVRKIIEQICFTASIRMAALYGAVAVASAEVVRQIWPGSNDARLPLALHFYSFVQCVAGFVGMRRWPMSVAGQTLVAGLLAESAAIKHQQAAHDRTLRKARVISVRIMAVTCGIGLVGGSLVYLARNLIANTMTTNPLVQAMCVQQLPIVALIMPISALCDMTESVFIAARCYQVVLRGMILGALFLGATLVLGASLGWGLGTMWIGLGVLFGVRVVLTLAIFRSPSSPIPAAAASQIAPGQLEKPANKIL